MKNPKPTTSISLSSNFTPKPLPNLSPKPIKQRPTLPLKILCNSNPNPNPKILTLGSLLRAIPDWADRVQERGMRQRRSLYDHEKWAQHRSSLRHVRHLLSSLSSRVILSLVPPVLAFTSFAAAIAGYNSAVLAHWLPDFFPVLRASSLPYQLTAPALALLLVFRTEASYSRFEEGRKAWTSVIAGANDFARLVVSALESSSAADAPLREALLRYIVAFPVALKCHLLYSSDVERDLENLLDGGDLEAVLSSKNRPRCVIQFISQSLQMLKLEESKRVVLESKVSCFHEGLGVCEQLVGTPIPLSYTRLTSRFLVLWHLTLPIILWDDCHWIVIPATFISAASLFCIEEVGVLIEEPFPALALEEICITLQKNVEEAVSSQNQIQSLLIAKRKIHSNTKKHSSNGHPKF